MLLHSCMSHNNLMISYISTEQSLILYFEFFHYIYIINVGETVNEIIF